MIFFLVYFFLLTGNLYKRKIVKIAGPRGAVLAVPMLMRMKAVSDHIEDLQAFGELLGG